MEVLIGLVVFFAILYFLVRLFILIVKLIYGSFQKQDDSYGSKNYVTRFNAEGTQAINRNSRVQKNKPPAVWYSKNQSVQINGYTLNEGMVYVGDNLPDSDRYYNDACLINPSFKVSSAEPWFGADYMSYWPRYSDISPACRGAYLKWLATGRSDPKAYIGYVFLFFYGLERRVFYYGQKTGITTSERLGIVDEVKRLLSIYGGNSSFNGYANNFLATEWVLYRSDQPIPQEINFRNRYGCGPFQMVLAQYVSAGKPIPADIALRWISLHPDYRLKTPARRCGKEFSSLFEYYYRKKFNDGLVVKPNKTALKMFYNAANPSYPTNLLLNSSELPNPFILTGPIKKFSAIVEKCTADLEPLSRFLGRKENDPESFAATALLPKELLSKSKFAVNARAQLEQLCNNGLLFAEIESIYHIVGVNAPLQMNKKESENLAIFVGNLGFGIAPDVRFHNLKPAIDGKVVVFPDGHGIDFQPSSEFRRMCAILRLGAMVSQVDQDISQSEEDLLLGFIHENRELTVIEKDSLSAFLHWCLHTPQGMAGIKRSFVNASSKEKTAISHILVSVAHVDGRIDPREVKQIEKLYTSLGLEKSQVISDIHALSANNGPVTVSKRDAETSYKIPKPVLQPSKSNGFQLNEELIRIREEETRQVKGVLEGIFAEQMDDSPEVDDKETKINDETNSLGDLDQLHQELLIKMMKQDTWDRPDLLSICKDLGLMMDGAMENLNEWAFEQANALLIEDGEPIYLDKELAEEIING